MNTTQAHMTYKAVAEVLDYQYREIDALVG